MQARRTRKTLLVNDGEPSLKKAVNEEFDFPMGCFDGAEIHVLGGIYNLKKKNVDLYSDDGLGVLQNLSGPETERLRKQIAKIFKNLG